MFDLLEVRMQKGEFTVIDATNSKTSEMNGYRELCNLYRYRMYCVDFTDIPIEEVKRRNAGREVLKRVPEKVIDKMYARFASQKIPSGIKVIKPDELDMIWMKMIDLSEYKFIILEIFTGVILFYRDICQIMAASKMTNFISLSVIILTEALKMQRL